jgi:hypothetical protein
MAQRNLLPAKLTPAVTCFVIGSVLVVIGLALIGTSDAAVSALVIFGVVLVGVGLAVYPWPRRQASPANAGSGSSSAPPQPQPQLAGAPLRAARASSRSPRTHGGTPKTVTWPAAGDVASYRVFDTAAPPLTVAAAAAAPSPAPTDVYATPAPQPVQSLQELVPPPVPLTPTYEAPYDDTAPSLQQQEALQREIEQRPSEGPVFYTPGQAVPYYRTPNQIAEERLLSQSRVNTPELDRKRRVGELAEIAAGLQQERNVFSVPMA